MWNISNTGNISKESRFCNDGNFSYKNSNKKEKENIILFVFFFIVFEVRTCTGNYLTYS